MCHGAGHTLASHSAAGWETVVVRTQGSGPVTLEDVTSRSFYDAEQSVMGCHGRYSCW